MPTIDLILSGVNLMLLGMGFVFSFLVLLVFSMLGVSRLASLLDKQAEPLERTAVTHARSPGLHSSGEPRAELVAVIAAAVTRYRQTHR